MDSNACKDLGEIGISIFKESRYNERIYKAIELIKANGGYGEIRIKLHDKKVIQVITEISEKLK